MNTNDEEIMKQSHDDVAELAAKLAAELPEQARPMLAAYIASATDGLGLVTVEQLSNVFGCSAQNELIALFENYWVAVANDSEECEEIEDQLDAAGVFRLVPLVLDMGSRFARALAVIDEQPSSKAKH